MSCTINICLILGLWRWENNHTNISFRLIHYNDVIMSAMGYQITGLTIVSSAVCWGADQRKRQSSASLAFVRGIRRWSVVSPHKETVTRKTFSAIVVENVSLKLRLAWLLLNATSQRFDIFYGTRHAFYRNMMMSSNTRLNFAHNWYYSGNDYLLWKSVSLVLWKDQYLFFNYIVLYKVNLFHTIFN